MQPTCSIACEQQSAIGKNLSHTAALRQRPCQSPMMRNMTLQKQCIAHGPMHATPWSACRTKFTPCKPNTASLTRSLHTFRSVRRIYVTNTLCCQTGAIRGDRPERREMILTLASISGVLLVCDTAQAIPLAPLGKGSDTIGGPKLQQPSLKQVRVHALIMALRLVLGSICHKLLVLMGHFCLSNQQQV